MSNEALYLIDAYGLIYRSYFAFMSRPIINPQGKNISALFGFARTLVTLLEEGAPSRDSEDTDKTILKKPSFLAAAFDPKGPTFRHKMYPQYKATRQKTPDDLHAQVPLVEEFLSALGIPVLKADNYEADDIIATLAKLCIGEKRQCYILSSDKDLLQLVGNGVWELRPSKTPKSDEDKGLSCDLIGPDEVKKEWGVSPDKVLDLLSLTGDSSDNVPGVKGVGEVTAVKLMSRYGSLDGIYENLAGIEGATGKKVAEGKESAYFSKSLIKLVYDVPLPVKNIEELSIKNLNRSDGANLLLREGIRQSARQLDPEAAKAKPAEANPANTSSASGNTPSVNGDSGSAPSKSSSGAISGNGAYKTIYKESELFTILEKAKKQKLLALDFETDSLDAWHSNPVGIALAVKPKEGFFIPLAPYDAENASPSAFLDPQKAKVLITPLLMDPSMTIAAHNAKFDYKVSRGWGIERWKCKIWDTMVAAWLLDPERGAYSMDSLSMHFFNTKLTSYNDIVPKGKPFNSIPLDMASPYACEDADYCLRLKTHLESLFKEQDKQLTNLFHNLEMPLLPILAEMEGTGIKIEPKILKDFGKELSEELDNIQASTYKIAGHEFNLSSTQQLQKVLFEERKLTPGKKTKTGYSTDVGVLEELARQDELPALILRHRTLQKLKSTYVDSLIEQADRGKRIHSNFIQTGTATGRLSSREPNLQNIPIRDEEGRRIREAFIAEPGKLLISADYSQIELVILAHLSKDENLVSAFKQNRDVHAGTASLIFSMDEKDISAEQRRIAKTINFGVMYGMSSFRLANELHITRTEAAAFIEAYFKTYSGVRKFIDRVIKETEETGFTFTILGRRRSIPTINSGNKTEKAGAERIAVNTPIQGSAADIVKTAMVNLDSALAISKSPARLLLQVHDELIFDCPKEEAEETAKLIKKEMESAVKLDIPLRVNVETGKSWGAFH